MNTKTVPLTWAEPEDGFALNIRNTNAEDVARLVESTPDAQFLTTLAALQQPVERERV